MSDTQAYTKLTDSLTFFDNYKAGTNCNFLGKFVRKMEDETCSKGSQAVNYYFKLLVAIVILTYFYWLIILVAVFIYCPKTRKIVIYQSEISQLQFSKKDEDNQDIQIINYNNQMNQNNQL